MSKQDKLARLALLLTAIIWGTSLTFAKQAMAVVPTNMLLALRFTIAAPIAAVIFRKRLFKAEKFDFIIGAVGGCLLFFSYSMQTFSIQYTTPGRAAFLNTTYCILVPFIAFFVFKLKLDKYNLMASPLCLAGVTVIGLSGVQLADLAPGDNVWTLLFGDAIALLSGFLFAFYIIIVSKYAKYRDPITLTIIQFAMAAVCAWIVSLTCEQGLLAAPTPAIVAQVIYLGIICTIVALLLQNIGQKHTPPATAAIILSLESIFGVIFPVIKGYDQLSSLSVIGFSLIFSAIIISETKLSFLKKF